MITVNRIENLTFKQGKLIAKNLFEKDKHPSNWKWTRDGFYGGGSRAYCILIDGEYHEIQIHHHDWYNLRNKKILKKK